MSIVDAIKKAKQLQQKARLPQDGERSPDDVRGPAAPLGQAHERPVFAVPASRGAVAPDTVPIAMPAPEFAHMQYEALKCSQNRILVPDAETRLNQLGSPSYRMLRTRLLRRAHVQNWSCIAITSPGAGEGKSMTSLNLALSIAREGNHDVFLIDLDMRNPSISNYLGITPPVDMVEFFNGNASAADLLFTVGIDRLTIASSTSTAANASELLATGRLRDLLGYIRQISPNPFILLDLPPIAVTDDALVVIPHVDATVLIVAEGKTNRDQLQRALGLLADFTVAGVVLNSSIESIGTDYYGA